ncbi:M28 family metallopeptidase [Pseudomonas sp. Gutcm_11s]|uniref:M28 family metallopeptidase n=1 Tax=Pseudomonas sp. Gutcm_11s TaxID=3026088 RepID=UPI00235E7B11|nr:M28 family metallopeptidase [Pseudomonas sp. Gutcm_11s]MDD0841533.1 M28 family metallopeptidase [Pseudomonas sp. Gutcm_11s]
MHYKKKLLFASLLSATAAPAFAGATQDLSQVFDKLWSPTRLGPLECRAGLLNSSPLLLPRCMQAQNTQQHLQMLHDVALANGGNRAAGLPGYDGSLNYVKETLERAGYRVTLQAFPFSAFYPQGAGVLQTVAPAPGSFEWEVDFTYLSQTDAGDVTAAVVPVDIALGAGNTSTSGCEAEDFAGFPAGSIALLQRGACNFQIKAENAANAGARGVVVFNQGDSEDRKGLLSATLGDAYVGGIPVLFTTYDVGVSLAQTAELRLRMVTDVVRERTQTYNLVAESKHGNPNNVVMAGAHLDSVYEGAGINDNGSGSAALLELAVQLRKVKPTNKLRFAWWGAEESGLVGSTYYVTQLPPEQKSKIKAYLNFDMIASPNFAYFVYDGDGSAYGLEGPPGSAAIEKLFEEYYKLRGLPFEGDEITFRSDYAQFFTDGIAFGGLFTGAEVLKTEEQAARYGGTAGIALDPCYHAACDNLGNIDERALEINGDAMAFVTSWLSHSTKAIDDEIAASQAAPSLKRAAKAYDITHWGKHWVK